MEVERNLAFDKIPFKKFNLRDENSFWSNEMGYDQDFNEGSFDYYYSNAMSKKLRKDKPAGSY